MADLLQFAQMQQPILSGTILPGIQNIVQNQRAKAFERDWSDAATAYQADPTSYSAYMNMYNLSPERTTQMTQGLKDFDEREQQNILQGNMELMAMLDRGDTAGAAAEARRRAEAYRNSGDSRYEGDDAQWDKFAMDIEAGNTQDMLGTIGIMNMAIPGGRAAMESWNAMRDQQMKAFKTDAEIAKIMDSIEITDPAQKEALGNALSSMPSGMGNQLAELLRLRKLAETDGGMTADQLADNEAALRKEFDSYVEPYMTSISMADQMEAMLAGLATGDVTGAQDFAVIREFNKIIDPNSTVRQSEADEAKSAQSLMGKLNTTLANIQEGDLLSDDVRRDILEATRVIREVARQDVTKQADRIDNTIRDFGYGRERIIREDQLKWLDEGVPASPAPAQVTTPQATPSLSFTVPSGDASVVTAAGINLGPMKQQIYENNKNNMSEDDIRALMEGDEAYIRNRFPKGYEWLKSQNVDSVERDW